MADADFLSEFGLDEKNRAEQEKLMQERAANLKRQRSWAVLSMLGTPEMQAAGRAQFGEASRQQAAMEQMAPAVLNRALAAQHLAISRGQLGLGIEALRTGNIFRQEEAVRQAYAPFLQEMMEQGGKVAVVNKWLDVFGIQNPFIRSFLTMNPTARVKHAEELMGKRGAAPPPVGGPIVPQAAEPPTVQPPAVAPPVSVPGAVVPDQWEAFRKKYPKKQVASE